MKFIFTIFPVVALLVGNQIGFAQGFVNLDFESVNISGYSPRSQIPVSDGLPGWTALFVSSTGTNFASQVLFDGISLGGAGISINDSSLYPGFVPFQGSYCATLFGGPFIGPTLVSAEISQTGLVPVGTQSLLVDIQQSGPPFFVVFLGGQVINMIPLQAFANYTVYGGDVSSFAGQVATLTFAQPAPPSNPPSGVLLDNIQFSSSSVPEPSEFALTALGALLLGCRRWKGFHKEPASTAARKSP
jgi:hypothetical protein